MNQSNAVPPTEIETKVYTSPSGSAVIEQANGSSVVLTSEQILAVIKDLRVCYDYCAAWKELSKEQTQ